MRRDLSAVSLSCVVLTASPLPTLGAQDTRAVRQALREIGREVERGNEPQIRPRLTRDAQARDPIAVLTLATLDRYAFHPVDAARSYRALLADRSPVIKAHARIGLAFLLAQNARYADAVASFDSAATLFVALRDTVGEAEATFGGGQARLRTAGVAASRRALARAKALAPSSDAWLNGHIACWELITRIRAGDSLGADAFRRARALSRDASLRAESTCVMAEVERLEGVGAVDAALALLDSLAPAQRRAGFHSGLAATRQWQGWLLLSVGRYAEARPALDDAVRIGGASGTLTAAGWANANLADLAQRVGSWSDGGHYARHSEQAFARAGDATGVIYARVLAASAAMATADLERAARLYVAVQPGLAQQNPREGVEVLAARSDIARRQGDLRTAAALLDSSAMLGRRLDMRGWNNEIAYRRALIALANGDTGAARRILSEVLYAQRGLSPLLRYELFSRLAEVAAHEGALTGARALLDSGFVEMDKWRASLGDRGLRLASAQTRAFDWDTDLGVASVVAALAVHDDAEAALVLTDRRRASVLREESARRGMLAVGERLSREGSALPPIDSVGRRAMGETTAVISYTTGNGGEPTTVFVVTAHATRAVVTTPTDSLSDITRRFVQFLAAGELSRPASRHLATALIDPVLPLLPPSVKRLVIVPDGSVHRVPFAALVLPNGSLLSQRFELATAPSVAIALHGLGGRGRKPVDQGSNRRVGALAFGAPTTGGQTSAEWAPLPGAHAELHHVAELVAGSDVVEGSLASLEGLRVAARRAGPVLHLATHARALENSLMSGAMVLAHDSARSGEVTTPEIASLSLPFELVVLSACESANGPVLTGEGLQGLAGAFLEAGAQSVLATRWRMEDRGAERFLDVFYQSLIRGLDAAGALAAARRAAIDEHISPAIWANFELLGDPAAAPVLKPAGTTPSRLVARVAMGVAACLLLYGAGFLVRRIAL